MRINLCNYQQPFGWWCTRVGSHEGPCALLPRFWNIKDRWKMRSK